MPILTWLIVGLVAGVLASLVMGPAFQESFNLAKGSIPARLGVSPD